MARSTTERAEESSSCDPRKARAQALAQLRDSDEFEMHIAEFSGITVLKHS